MKPLSPEAHELLNLLHKMPQGFDMLFDKARGFSFTGPAGDHGSWYPKPRDAFDRAHMQAATDGVVPQVARH